jgi:hypothetical protein
MNLDLAGPPMMDLDCPLVVIIVRVLGWCRDDAP